MLWFYPRPIGGRGGGPFLPTFPVWLSYGKEKEDLSPPPSPTVLHSCQQKAGKTFPSYLPRKKKVSLFCWAPFPLYGLVHQMCLRHTDKKDNKSFLIFKEIKRNRVQSHMWLTRPPVLIYGGNICVFPHILGSPSSYMTFHPIPSEFPYIWGKFCFLF